MNERVFSPTEKDINKRVDVFLSEVANETRSSIQKLISQGNITATKDGVIFDIEKKSSIIFHFLIFLL